MKNLKKVGKMLWMKRVEWKNGKMEWWKNVIIRQFDNSTMEERKNGRMERWKNEENLPHRHIGHRGGRMEGWKNVTIRRFDNGRMESWSLWFKLPTHASRLTNCPTILLSYCPLPTGHCPLPNCRQPTSYWLTRPYASRLTPHAFFRLIPHPFVFNR